MSFTCDTALEAFGIQFKKNCCKRAFALGISLGARSTEGKRELRLSFREREIAERTADILNSAFHAKAIVTEEKIVGRNYYTVIFFSFGIWDLLKAADASLPLSNAAGLKGECCDAAFLRGIFVGCGSVTDPKKTYHLELTFPNASRADAVADVLGDRFGKWGKITRGQRTAIYYKSNGAITDFLYAIGCIQAGYAISNSFIERDIRNVENRATNCVARNISRSVGAAREQISAIERLIETRKLDQLTEELRYTARLRIENDSASLSELAMLHEPPITKSGLNGRLKRLMEAAEKI